MPDLVARLTAVLQGRYAIERELGSGGMATVWAARDLRYDRAVAVKVLRPDLSAALGAERFLREIRITAQLNHPHILPLLDSGEADGLLFYVMPFVAGGSLRERLVPGAALPLDVALHVATHVAGALDHAHRHGIVHRDVKPENVLFSDGEPVVADFGIARAVSSADAGALTRTGVPLGTPGYMSPEQAAGGARLDARTDVFGLGCVIYEMLVGATPEVWPTGEEVRLGRFVDAQPAHRAQLDRLPGRVEQVLARAVAVRSSDRFETPGEFADALAVAAEGAPRLSGAEVEAVLRRAAEIQALQPTEEGALTLGAVEQVAAEVGIPPEQVRQAAREVVGDRRPVPAAPPTAAPAAPPWPAPRAPVAAAPFVPGLVRTNVMVRGARTWVERVVPGEVTAAAHGPLADTITSLFVRSGTAESDGDALVWRSASPASGGRDVVVTVTPVVGTTRVRIEESLVMTTGTRFAVAQIGAAAGGLVGLVGALAVLGFIGGHGQVQPFVLLPLAIMAAFGAVSASRIYLMTSGDERAPHLAALADRLAAHVAQRLLPPAAPGSPELGRLLP